MKEYDISDLVFLLKFVIKEETSDYGLLYCRALKQLNKDCKSAWTLEDVVKTILETKNICKT